MASSTHLRTVLARKARQLPAAVTSQLSSKLTRPLTRRVGRFLSAHHPVAQAYLNQKSTLRRAGQLLSAHTLSSLAEVGFLVVTLASAASSGLAVAPLTGWALAHLAHTVLDYRLRRTLSTLAETATQTLTGQLGQAAQRQRGAHRTSSGTTWHQGAAALACLNTVRDTLKYHLPFIAIDTVSCLAAATAATAVAVATHTSLGAGLLLIGACAAGALGHRILLHAAKGDFARQQHHQQHLLHMWQRVSDAPTAEFLRRSKGFPTQTRRLERAARQLHHASADSDKHRLRSGMLSRTLSALVIAGAVVAAVGSAGSLASLPVVFLLITQALGAAMRLPDNLLAISQALPASRELSALLQAPWRIPPATNPIDLAAATRTRPAIVRVRCATLLYPGNDPTVSITGLAHLSFTASPGQVVMVTGPIGAGKSSLLRAIARREDLTSGSISVADVQVRHASFDSLDTTVLLMAPETHLEPGSVVANVQAAYPGVTIEQAQQALRQVGLDPAVIRAAGNDSSGLSSGQARLVEMARLLVHPAKVLLLDEPTANLDPASRAAFPRLLGMVQHQGRTVIVATHDQQLLPYATAHLHFTSPGHAQMMQTKLPSRPSGHQGASSAASRWQALPVRASAPAKPVSSHNRKAAPGFVAYAHTPGTFRG